MIAWLHAAIVIFLVAVFPPADRHFAKRATRVQLYATAIIVSWCVTILLVATIPLRQIWFAPPLPARAPVWLLIEIAAVMLFVVFVSARRGKAIDFLAPRGRTERIVFVFAALSAGICEEIIYRGFMIRFFEHWSGLTTAVILAALAADAVSRGGRSATSGCKITASCNVRSARPTSPSARPSARRAA